MANVTLSTHKVICLELSPLEVLFHARADALASLNFIGLGYIEVIGQAALMRAYPLDVLFKAILARTHTEAGAM